MKTFIFSTLSALCLAAPLWAQDQAELDALRTSLRVNPVSTEALTKLEAYAEAGNARAAMMAADGYRNGLGAPRDLDKAFALAGRAVELGNSWGLIVQGDITRQKGRNSPEAVQAGRVFLDKAADLGNQGALERLARDDQSAYVIRVQQALAAKGHPAGVADGVIGPKTLGALAAYCAGAEISEACGAGELAELPVLRALVRSGLFRSE